MRNPIYLQRLACYLYNKNFKICSTFLILCIRFLYSCYLSRFIPLPVTTVLGYGGLGIVIHDRVFVGENCHIDQNVTIGGTSKLHDVPRLGSNVYVGAGAVIIGSVIIGDDVVIGANSVVTKNVPSNCLVVGAPAVIKKYNIKKSNYV